MPERKCPQCGAPTAWEGNRDRPFCSERCRLLDLAGWLGERYVIPGDPVPDGAPPGEAADEDAPGKLGR